MKLLAFLIIIVVASAIACKTTVTNSSIDSINAKISVEKRSYNSGEDISLTLEIKNIGQESFTYLPWGTPIENGFTNDCLDVKHDGVPVDYIGIMVKRRPPEKEDYITLHPLEISTGVVNILDGYPLTDPGTYTVQFKERYGGIPASNTIEFSLQ